MAAKPIFVTEYLQGLSALRDKLTQINDANADLEVIQPMPGIAPHNDPTLQLWVIIYRHTSALP